MTKSISMHQPHFFPWIGLIDKINKSDVFVFLDLVQLENGSRMYRNKFLTNNGQTKYLTVPFIKKNYLSLPYKEIKINEEINWKTYHINFLENNYKKAPFFDEIWPHIVKIYDIEFALLSDFCIESTKLILKLFDVKTPLLKQSDLYPINNLENNLMIIDICSRIQSDHYISGKGGEKYIDINLFSDNNIDVSFQELSLKNYFQFSSKEHTFDVSALDILFNLGITKSRDYFYNIHDRRSNNE